MARTLRLVSFNILEGLRPLDSLGDEGLLLDEDRLGAARSVVNDLDPDILVLNEALYCRPFAGSAVDYGGLFRFRHEIGALYDGAWGNAILSRHPITRSREMPIHNRGGLSAVIDTPMGGLTVASYHPHPRRQPENKALDFVDLLAGLEGPLLVCGDLNCISPDDSVDRTELVEAFRRFSPEPEATVDRFIESGRQVFAAMARLGLSDAVPVNGRRYSIPTDLINLDKRSGIRIDHIFANAAVEVVAGEVVQTPASNRASDHHPVTVEFRIRPE